MPFLPEPVFYDNKLSRPEKSIGRVKAFHGHFLVVLKALSYVLTLGDDGIADMSKTAVLNANYLKKKLEGHYELATDGFCMHEFVVTLESLKKEKGVGALQIAKAMLDYKIHPPTMYFPLTVHEALMFEPTETESKSTLDKAVKIYIEILNKAKEDPDSMQDVPHNTPVRKIDETTAARNPILIFKK